MTEGSTARSARSVFVISALLCISSPAMSTELERPSEERSPRGLLGHTTIRTYGAIVPAVPEQSLDHVGWGTGFTVSYGVTRAIQLSLGLAYYQFQVVVTPDIDCDCSTSIRDAVRQTTISVDVQSPTRSWLRPWLGVGFGVYDVAQTLDIRGDGSRLDRVPESGTRLGVHWGAGLSTRLDKHLAIDLGGRYHHGFGEPFLATPGYWRDVRLFSVQAGLSYVMH